MKESAKGMLRSGEYEGVVGPGKGMGGGREGRGGKGGGEGRREDPG